MIQFGGGISPFDRKKKYFKHIIGLLILAIVPLAGYFWYTGVGLAGDEANNYVVEQPEAEERKADRMEKHEIRPGDVYGKKMEEIGINKAAANAVYEASRPLYDLARIGLGKNIEIVYGKDSGQFKEFIYKIDSEEEISVKMVEGEEEYWEAERRIIPYEVAVKYAEGKIETCLYLDALEQGIDERAIIKFADALQWSIDFAQDPRIGDTYKFFYEERSLQGEYAMPGRIIAGAYQNAGKTHQIYYFEESDENKGYFDEHGNSVQKMFLKAPLSFKYISSGFTTGLRYIQAFDTYTGHRAIDYAASTGTPIRTVGDGTVAFAGWDGGYGYKVSIRHNGTYSTNYCHQSKIAVKKGQKVKQGEVIGYVGSTGYSTGPHLHYEMVKNGVKVNPLKEVLPLGEPIKEKNKGRFHSSISEYQKKLNLP